MITLYGFGPLFSLPDPSQFVMKAEVLLKMSGLPYKIDLSGFRKAPKGKLPYINDDGERIAEWGEPDRALCGKGGSRTQRNSAGCESASKVG